MASGVGKMGPDSGASPPDLMLDSIEMLPADARSSHVRVEVEVARGREREAELLTRAKAGEERALRIIYDDHENQVRCHLHRLLGSDSEIDDLVQVVFSRAFLAIDRFEGKSSLSTWLYRITVNTTHNLLRQRFRRNRMQHALRRFETGRGGDRVSATKLQARDEAQRILERLKPDLRQVFVLYHYEGLTLQEISVILERPISTVGDRLTRARKRLRELVRES